MVGAAGGVIVEVLKKNGGFLDEYRKFLDKAPNSALKVNSKSDIIGQLP